MAAISPSNRSSAIQDSITLAIAARAQAMRAEGIDVISLGAGEPDFNTPENIAEAGISAIREGHTRYTAATGLPELRKAATGWFQHQFGLDYETEEVMVTAGAKPALALAVMALANDGDRVLLPTPFWPSYPDIVRIGGGKPIELEPVNGFIHSGEEIAKAAVTHGAKGMIINFPNNPSGAVPTAAQVESIVDAAHAHDMWIISDEIYARLIYGDSPHISPATFAKGRDRCLVVNGGTKSHSMTGWRLGFLAGPAEIIDAVGRLQSQAIGNPCTISQEAAIEVCNERDDSEFRQRLAAFEARRDFLDREINKIDGLSLDSPAGAFYAFVDVVEVCAKLGIDDIQLAERLLLKARVATVPGTAFRSPGHIRLSYAASMEDLERGVTRIRDFLSGS